MSKYFRLNPHCSVRNEKNCSYLVNIYSNESSNPLNFDSIAVPPFMGYIFSLIGKYPVEQAFSEISAKMKISEKSVENFVSQLISSNSPKKFTLSEDCSVVLPENILIESESPDNRIFRTTTDFSFQDDFETHRPYIPFSVNIMTTIACYTDCVYCYADRSVHPEMTTEQILSLLDNLHDSGVVNVTLTGGDMMMRKDWQSLMARMMNYGYNPFISTKTPLAKEDVEALKHLGLNEIQFSLDSIDPQICNALVKGGTDYIHKVKEMLSLCDRYGLKVKIRTVITKLNQSIDDIKDMYDFLRQYECIGGWDITPAFFSGPKRKAYSHIMPGKGALKGIYDFCHSGNLTIPVSTAKMDQDGFKLKRCSTTDEFVCKNQVCLANVTAISILANGKCTICEMLYENPEYIIGDINTQSLAEVWNSSKALDFYYPCQDTYPVDTPCSTCKDFDKCRKGYGKRICYSDLGKTGLRKYDPDPRCPLAKDVEIIL